MKCIYMHSIIIDLCEEYEMLKDNLVTFNQLLASEVSHPESLYATIQSTIRGRTENALKSVESKDVRDQMYYLCNTSFDVPTGLRGWAMEEVSKICESLKENEISKLIPVQAEVTKSLMDKDTLYHASVCCRAVSTCTTATLKKYLSGVGHNLDAVSMSISREKENIDRYMIAKQGNIVYMAFRSEPTVSDWIESAYGTFANGKNMHACIIMGIQLKCMTTCNYLY